MTNQPPAKPPREFLILYRESNRMFNSYRIDDSQLANEHLNDQTYRNAGIPQREAIHVIEKSYASRLEQELAFVKTQWKQTSDLLEQERNRLAAELADVRKERDEAAEIIDVWKSRSEINGKLAIKLQDERDKEVRQADVLAIALATYRNHEFCECGVEGCNDCAEDCGVRAYVDGELLAYRAFRGSK